MMIPLPNRGHAVLYRELSMPANDALIVAETITSMSAHALKRDAAIRRSPCRLCSFPHCCRLPVGLTQLEALVINECHGSKLSHDRLVAKYQDERAWHLANMTLTPGHTPELCPLLDLQTNQCTIYDSRPSTCVGYWLPEGFKPSCDCEPKGGDGRTVPMLQGPPIARMELAAMDESESYMPSSDTSTGFLQYSGIATVIMWLRKHIEWPAVTWVDKKTGTPYLTLDGGKTWEVPNHD